MLRKPLEWRKPRRIFVNSMSDFFHEKIHFDFLDKVLDVIRATPQHTYQVLTKRSRRMLEYGERIGRFPDNMWLGVSVGTNAMKFKIDDLRKAKARTRFLSLEPLLESLVPLNLAGIHWVIVGGLSGPHWKEHEMDLDWAREIRDLCIRKDIPFFFKQSSAWKPGQGTFLDGRKWRQFPEAKRHHRRSAAP
jgi:protein gp37